MKTVLAVLFLGVTLYGGIVTVPGDEAYVKRDAGNTQLLYTVKNRPFAEQAASLEPELNALYRRYYGFSLDSRLYVGLISERNQIANGFSTQFPLNMQVNYPGGSQRADYFSSTSWLKTLLYHETAHNYQFNPKKSAISREAHRIFGNTGVIFVPIPVFTIPNITESPFLYEGNAVLNESWHGNGGRLYSGRFKAETLMQAKAGNIFPQRVYNKNLFFPYGDQHYIVGGFFQLYLAERFGLERTNRYFWNHSGSWLWPFRTNHIFRQTFGIGYEEALEDFNAWLLFRLDGFCEAEGEEVAASQFFAPLNRDDAELFFLTSDALRAPELVRIEKNSGVLKRERGSWGFGRVLHLEEGYVTQASFHTDPTRITQGLFDKEGFLVEGSGSKTVQGYLSDGRAVYLDVPGSFDEPQLYVGGEFYGQINSSVVIDGADNLYYFKQQGKMRTLYRNKTPLWSMQNFYGFVCDVDEQGRVYFVANSLLGSSLYRYSGGTVERVSRADNIVDARLSGQEELLVASVGSEGYRYLKTPLQVAKEQPEETTLFFEKERYYGAVAEHAEPEPEGGEEPYRPLANLHYSALFPSLGYSSDAGALFSFSALFADPLLQNTLSLFAQRSLDETTLAGAAYANSEHLLQYGVSAYGVLEHKATESSRGYGGNAYLSLPYLQKGYLFGDATLSFFLDHESETRQPLSLTLSLGRNEHYGKSMFANYSNQAYAYGEYDRDDLVWGGKYEFWHDLPKEFYIGIGAQFSKTDAAAGADERGVKVTDFQGSFIQDPSAIVMPTISDTVYVRQGVYGELSAAKVFNLDAYFFTFPLSLRREALSARYRHYRLEDFAEETHRFNEIGSTLTLDLLWFNVLPIPLSVAYFYNDNTRENHHLLITVGASF
jgi:hypothetical protein